LKEQQVKNDVSKQPNSNQNNNNQLKRKRDENVTVKEVKEEIPNNASRPANKPIVNDDMFMAAANNDFPEQV